jgi:hypothetical protein
MAQDGRASGATGLKCAASHKAGSTLTGLPSVLTDSTLITRDGQNTDSKIQQNVQTRAKTKTVYIIVFILAVSGSSRGYICPVREGSLESSSCLHAGKSDRTGMIQHIICGKQARKFSSPDSIA